MVNNIRRRRHVRHGIQVSSLLAFASLIGGCASINQFSVTPRAACRGSTVSARWSAQGKVRLTSRPMLPGTGAQPSSGEKTFVVDQSTQFVLHASSLFSRSKPVEADVDVAPAQRSYGAHAQCDANTRLITAQVVLNDQLSKQFRVDTIGNPLPRLLRVSKGGQTAHIAPGGQSDAFHGVLARGTWQLASPLKAGESCDDAMHTLRQKVGMQLKLQCGG